MGLYAIPCVLFAGGKSSRMGEDKAFLPFGEHESLIAYQVKRLKTLFSEVYISAKEEKKYSELNTKVIEDRFYSEISAPTTGFFNINKFLKNKECFFVLSVDTPFVNKDIIDRLLKVDTKMYDAVIVKTPLGIHPLCGIYTQKLAPHMQEMIENDDHKITKLLKKSKVFYLEVQEEVLLSNLNTPDEYHNALKILKQHC